MGKRAIIYTAGMLFVSPMVYTKDVGTSGTLPTFKAGDPDCVLPEGLSDASQSSAASPLLQVKSYRASSAALSPVTTNPAGISTSRPNPREQARRREQYGSKPTAATRLGSLGPTGPGAARPAGQQYASAPPAWPQGRSDAGYARQAYPQRSMNAPGGGMGGRYPQAAAMPSFGAWPTAVPRSAAPHRPSGRSGSGSGMGMGSRPSSQPNFSAAPQRLAIARPAAATPMVIASPAVAAPAGWMPYGRPGYPMPMMPTAVPYGVVPLAAAIPAPAGAVSSAVASPREAQLAAQVQQMEQRLRDLEARLQQGSGQRP